MDSGSRSGIHVMISKTIEAGLLFAFCSMLIEASFILLFVNNYLGIVIYPIAGLFSEPQFLKIAFKVVVAPLLSHLSSTLYIWTLTSMAVTSEAVFLPLLLSG